MSFKKSMEGSDRSTRAKVRRQRVPDRRLSKAEDTFTLFGLDGRNLKLVLRERTLEARREFQ